MMHVAMVGPPSLNSDAFIPELAFICLVLECSIIHDEVICNYVRHAGALNAPTC